MCACASVRVCACARVRVCACARVRVCECACVRVGMDIDYKMILVHHQQISLVGSRLPENLSYHNWHCWKESLCVIFRLCVFGMFVSCDNNSITIRQVFISHC